MRRKKILKKYGCEIPLQTQPWFGGPIGTALCTSSMSMGRRASASDSAGNGIWAGPCLLPPPPPEGIVEPWTAFALSPQSPPQGDGLSRLKKKIVANRSANSFCCDSAFMLEIDESASKIWIHGVHPPLPPKSDFIAGADDGADT